MNRTKISKTTLATVIAIMAMTNVSLANTEANVTNVNINQQKTGSKITITNKGGYLTQNSKEITGYTTPGAPVTIWYNNCQAAFTADEVTGYFSYEFDEKLITKRKVRVDVLNSSDLDDIAETVYVPVYTQPKKPQVSNEFISPATKTIWGSTTPGYTGYAYVNGKYYKCVAKEGEGFFQIKIPQAKVGSTVKVFVKGTNGVNSEVINYKVTRDVNKPNVTTTVSTNSTSIKGKIDKYFNEHKLIAEINGKTYNTWAIRENEFGIAIPAQKAGTKIKVYYKNPRGTKSAVTTLTVVKAPNTPKLTKSIYSTSKTIEGTGQAGYTATAKINNKYYTATINKSGKFSIKIPKLKKGTVVKLYVKNKANGTYSKTVSTKVK